MKKQYVFKNRKSISEATLRRLPVYYHYLKKLDSAGVYSVSCTRIAKCLGFGSIQIRKDFESTRCKGRPKVGYILKDLIKHIESFLGFNTENEAVLVGAGHLGNALLGYHGFREFGLNIIAAFDSSPDKIDRFINHKKIFSVKRLEEIIARMGIKIGILTVPAAHAQELADRMISAGIKALWNFAPVKINVPKGVFVQHENLASSLAVLSKKIETIKK